MDTDVSTPFPNTTPPALQRAAELAEVFEGSLEHTIGRVCEGGVDNLHDAMSYALGLDLDRGPERGKRIRPTLCLLAADALGADLAAAMPFATAIELMHNFCLVHDDIEDGDRLRRGREAVWIKYGLPHAINIGDYLLIHAHRVLIDIGGGPSAPPSPPPNNPETQLRLLDLFSKTLDHTHIGQALDMNARASRSISLEDYMRIVREKTGHYLAAPIQGGAIVGGADDKTLQAIGEMAALLGPMFQIIDDIIDLTEGKGRESVGSDIREGKRSYLVAYAAAEANEKDCERLFDILDAPRDATSDTDVGWAKDLFKRTGAIEAGRDQCRALYEESKQILRGFPASLADALGPVFENLAERNA